MKVIDPLGEMLAQEWEKYASLIINSRLVFVCVWYPGPRFFFICGKESLIPWIIEREEGLETRIRRYSDVTADDRHGTPPQAKVLKMAS